MHSLGYPTAADIRKGWAALADEIAASAGKPARADTPRGELLVIGSGFSHSDFTSESEAEILAADDVFYCLYDPITQIWLHQLKPGAFDLSVLYSDTLDRHFTYLLMSEAMLVRVRQGRKVVAIYYGHPGVFAMPTHRAIRIARREGYRATMRPGISALDYLVADVGFDPALPGLQSYEATDMLLRRRPMDTSLHVVLWQVGVVGEFKFAVAGFENRGFDMLVDELERTYGGSWQLTHYIAPHYAGVDPFIERYSISSLRELPIRERITGSSTFYLEPMRVCPTDLERSVSLGLTKAGEPAPPPVRPYHNDEYGEQELAAITGLDSFRISESYYLPQPTPAFHFMLALSREPDLQSADRRDPYDALNTARFGSLTERARKLLAIPHPAAIAAALAEPERSTAET